MAFISIDISQLDELNRRIEASMERVLLSTNESGENRNTLKAMIRLRISKGMKTVADRIQIPVNHSGFEEAVQHGAFKTQLGGTVRITDAKKKSGKKRPYTPKRSTTGRTAQINQYYGVDRAFILRFVNSGTDVRTATKMNGGAIKRTERPTIQGKWKNHTYKSSTYKGAIGNRGAISGKAFFDAATGAFMSESSRIAADIETMAQQVMNDVFNG